MVTRSFTKKNYWSLRHARHSKIRNFHLYSFASFVTFTFKLNILCFISNNKNMIKTTTGPFTVDFFKGKILETIEWERERERLRYNFQTPFLRNFYQANTTERKRESIETEKTNSFEIGKKVRVFFRQNFVVASSCCTSPCVRACVWAGFSACCSVQATTATRCPACLGIPKCGVRVARTLRPFSLTLSCYLLSFLFSTFFLHLLHVLSS